LNLVEFSIYEQRKITKNEEQWFDGGFYIHLVLDNCEWEDIATLYSELSIYYNKQK
jgi:hypothetical protein